MYAEDSLLGGTGRSGGGPSDGRFVDTKQDNT